MDLVSINNVSIEDVNFFVKAGTNNGVNSGTAVGSTPTGNRGNSIYGIYLRASTNITFERVAVNTGAAGAGANGANGTNGFQGESGGNGGSGDCDDDCKTVGAVS